MSHHLQVIHVKDGASFRKLEIPYNKKIGAGCETLFLPINRRRALKIFFSDIIDQLHDDHGLSYTGTTK